MKKKIVFLLTLLIILSGCSVVKENKSPDDYAKKVSNVASLYNYKIENSSKTADSYSAKITNGVQSIDLNIKIGDKNQYDSYEIVCENPADYTEVMAITNELSKKKFTKQKVENVINNDNKFYNVNEEYVDKSLYDFFRIDYIGNSADYCVEYSSVNELKPVLIFNGFTKGDL